MWQRSDGGYGRWRAWNTRGTNCILHGSLENGLVEMVTASLAGETVHIESRGGEDPLPRPFPPGMRVLPQESSG